MSKKIEFPAFSACRPDRRAVELFCDHHPDTGEVLPGMTRQEFTDECDINKLMARYEKIGIISHVNQATPQWGDFTNIPDFAEAQQMFVNATAAFMALPASLRRDFDNDPRKFVDAMQSPSDELRARLLELGLAEVAEAPIAEVELAPGAPVGAPGAAPKAPVAPSANDSAQSST